MSNVIPIPLTRWPGADPETVAAELYAQDYLDDRTAVLMRHSASLGRQMARIGIPRLDRRTSLDDWYQAVFESENRLYANAPGRDAL